MRRDRDINEIIGRRIRDLRDAKDLTQDDLGEALGIKGESVSRKETGVTPFTIWELYVVAEFFQCGLSALLPPAEPDEDEWAPEGEVAAYYNGIAPDMKPAVKAMIKAAHDEAQRRKTTRGRKAE